MGIFRGGKPVPVHKYCTNCGTEEYEIEKIENLNFFNMNYAIAKKEEEDFIVPPELTETWIDEVEIIRKLKCLPINLN